jgi:hypothetical protein
MICNAAEAICDIRPAADLDAWELLMDAIGGEAAELRLIDRSQLAKRVLAPGGDDSADGPERENARARLAVRLPARLSRSVA